MQFSILCDDDDRCHLVNDLIPANRLLGSCLTVVVLVLLLLFRMLWTTNLFGNYCYWSPVHLCAEFFQAHVRRPVRFVYSIDPSFRQFEIRIFDRTLWHFRYLLERVCKSELNKTKTWKLVIGQMVVIVMNKKNEYSQIYAIKVTIILDIVQNVIHHHRTDTESPIRI